MKKGIAQYLPKPSTSSLIALLIVTFCVFSPSLQNGFVNWDDTTYIVDNESIRSLSFDNIRRIFSDFIVGNYQPLSVLTFAVEYKFAGHNPQVYHLTNLLLHLVNIVLVYIWINLLIRDRRIAFLTCLLFAFHPMRVESVAWATERKDVLFLMFYVSGLIAYHFYLVGSKTNRRWLVGVFSLFLLSLLSKPAAVSFPLALLLVDCYVNNKVERKDILEKIPFFAFSIGFGVLALYAASQPFYNPYPLNPDFSLIERFFLSFHALFLYGLKLLWPAQLSAFYPYPERVNGSLPLIYYLSILVIIFIAWDLTRTKRYKKELTFCFLFFVSTIIFNLPLFGQGFTIVADRFTYLPAIGFFLAAALFLTTLGENRKLQWLLVVISVGWVGLMPLQTYARTLVWKDSGSLWSDVIQKYPHVPLAYYNRADFYFKRGELDKAIEDSDTALSLYPDYAAVYNNRGNMHFLNGDLDLAITDYHQAIALKEEYTEAYLNRAEYYRHTKKYSRAMAQYEAILSYDPHNEVALERKKNLVEKINAAK